MAKIVVAAVIFIISALLWNTFVLYPVKMFVVVLHELSHGLAAVLMGGGIERIQIDARIGGYCAYYLPAAAGFFRQAFVASAGYLGSMLWGCLIFMAAARSRRDREITLSIGIIVLALSFFVIKSGELFGILFCFAFSAMLLAAYKWFPDLFHDLFLKFLGLTGCLYVLIDIKEDLIDRSGIGSDADALARLMGIPQLSIVIGIAWVVLALLVLWFSLKASLKS